MRVNGFLLFLLIVFTTVTTSCNSSRKVARQRPVKDTTTTVPIVVKDTVSVNRVVENDEAAAIQTYSSVWMNTIRFSTFNGKAQMSYAGDGQEQDFTAQFRIEKDKAIWISVTALGGIVNVARALITPDSIKAVIYLQKEYVLLPMSEAQKLLPVRVDFSSLQNLILGNPIVTVSTPQSFREEGNTLTFSFQEEDKNQLLAYEKEQKTLRGNMLTAGNINRKQILNIQLSGYNRYGSGAFATSRTIQISDNNKRALVTMDFKDFQFDEAVDLPFSIPKSYKKKDLE